VLEVRDRGPGFDRQMPERPPAPSVLRGRGLVIVRALVDELTTGRDDRWTVMRAARPLATSRV
jgi:anti-sigma regulatory factor (Ser/Thr protein kinase)